MFIFKSLTIIILLVVKLSSAFTSTDRKYESSNMIFWKKLMNNTHHRVNMTAIYGRNMFNTNIPIHVHGANMNRSYLCS